MRHDWMWVVLLAASGCASSASSVPAAPERFTGNFGGNTFDARSVSGPSVRLARDGTGSWNGTIGCRFQNGRPTLHVCPFHWDPEEVDGLPRAIGAPGPGGYLITRKGHSLLLMGNAYEFQFATKVDADFPAELLAPLFFAVAMNTDPARDLVSSDPPLGLTEYPNPATQLVWVITVGGVGDVSIRRGPATSPVEIGSSNAKIFDGPVW
jgi:hypothetical protein